MKTWEGIFTVVVISLCTADAKTKENDCKSSGGTCISNSHSKIKCVKLPYICGSDEVCCKREANKGKNTKKKINGKDSEKDIKCKCRKTNSKCKREGGMCIPTENTTCNMGVVSSLCKGASCKCCIGEKQSCSSLPKCKFFGGFCMSEKYSYICKGTVDKTSCASQKCACCLIERNCKCGQVNTNRIVGGNDVSPRHKYPWMAHIYALGKTLCGGSIINDRYILTAAHCVIGLRFKYITVVLADYKQHSNNDDIPGITTEVNIENFKVHENYNGFTANNDIAIIKLKESLDLSAHKEIQSICLPANASETYEGVNGTVIGWGLKDYYDISYPGDLQEVTIPIWEPKCEGYSGITKNMLCAGLANGGKDSCNGDSGGPLFVNEGNTYTLVGIVSWGYGCAEANSPGVYTRVSQFLHWILLNTPDANYCS